MKNWKTTGEDPDYRFTLANERTFLAWVRTGLGFFVAAVAIDQLGVYMALTPTFVGCLSPLAGSACCVLSQAMSVGDVMKLPCDIIRR